MNKQYPMQAEFNKDHKEPICYSEVGDIYALSTEYSAEEAGKLFEKKWKSETGDKVDFHYSIGVASVRKIAHPDEPNEETWFVDIRNLGIHNDAQAIIIHGF